MNTQILGIPSTVRRSDDHLIPAPASILPLIERLASSHAAVLEKWKTKFALDLRRSEEAVCSADPAPEGWRRAA